MSRPCYHISTAQYQPYFTELIAIGYYWDSLSPLYPNTVHP